MSGLVGTYELGAERATGDHAGASIQAVTAREGNSHGSCRSFC